MVRAKKIAETRDPSKDKSITVSNSTLPDNLELNQSEIQTIKLACANAGLSINNYVKAIKDALSATKITIDKYGEEHVENDHDKRLKAALIGLELEGYIKNKVVANDNRKFTQINYSWKTVN